MPVGLLFIGICTGLVMALVWFFSGGTLLSTLGIYVVSGNLAIFGFLLRGLRRGGAWQRHEP